MSNKSIKKKLVVIIVFVGTFTGFIAYSSFVYWFMNNQYENILKESKTVALILGQDVAKLTLLNELSAAADITTKLKSFSKLDSAVLYNLEKNPILQYSKDDKGFKVDKLNYDFRKYIISGNSLKLITLAKYQGTKLGYVELSFKISTVVDVIKADINVLIFIFILMTFVSYFLASIFARRFTEPILNLVSFLDSLNFNKSINKRVFTKERNEFKKLYDEVNLMLNRLEDSYEELKIASVAFEAQAGITITDKNQNILKVNKAFANITGYRPNEVIGKTPRILNSGIHDKKFYDEMFNSLRKYKLWMGEITNRRKNGNLVNELLTIQSVLDDNGEVIYYVASFLDLTFQKEMELKLKEKELMLIQQSKMAAMGEMLENIAHQWRQPLSLISSISTSLILHKEIKFLFSEEDEKKQLEKINETIQYLSTTIDDFRSFFKPDKEKSLFSLQDIYKKALLLVNEKFGVYNIEVIEDLKEVNIYALKNEYIQVIINILNNAKDQLLKLENKRRLIFVSVIENSDNIILSIKDNANGVPLKIKDKIFEPYFTTKLDSKGTGIGLYMSHEMITKHMNGALILENEKFTFEGIKYKGANFKIIIPKK